MEKGKDGEREGGGKGGGTYVYRVGNMCSNTKN